MLPIFVGVLFGSVRYCWAFSPLGGSFYCSYERFCHIDEVFYDADHRGFKHTSAVSPAGLVPDQPSALDAFEPLAMEAFIPNR